jgi:hypothetical protein
MKRNYSIKTLLEISLIIFLFTFSLKGVYATNTFEETVSLKIGECRTLILDNQGEGVLNWNTGNQDVATVDKNGKVCAIGKGKTYISVTSANGAFHKQFDIIVVAPESEDSKNELAPSAVQSTIDGDVLEIMENIISHNLSENISSQLKVSDNKRYLVFRKNEQPFLFLGQTLWSMARRLNREEILQVLDICKEQGFTAIQVLAHGHYMGPNTYGKLPFDNENFLRPLISSEEYDWWDHLEFIIEECIKREMFVCLLPTWREQWHQKKNLNENNAFAYGKFIGQRYRKYNPWIVWVMGGDHHPENPAYLKLHRQLAKGVATGINGQENYDNLMMSYHTHGPTSTVDYFAQEEPFMDFNTIQSGHSLKNLEGMIEKGYTKQHKPIMDFEPFYTKNGENTDEVRTTIYWGVFAGGFGTSYGSWNIWHCGARNDLAKFKIPEAFYEGFGPQIKYLGELLTSAPMLLRIPSQDLLVNNQTTGLDRILACTATDKSYAMVFTPHGEPFIVDLYFIEGEKIYWYWFNPRNGEIQSKGAIGKKSIKHQFIPPTRGERFSGDDWVLVLGNSEPPPS